MPDIPLPCGHTIPTPDLLRIAGRAMSAARVTRRGGATRSKRPHCPCGAMTAARAKKRRHRCEIREPEPDQ